jgi:hypothetical protein
MARASKRLSSFEAFVQDESKRREEEAETAFTEALDDVTSKRASKLIASSKEVITVHGQAGDALALQADGRDAALPSRVHGAVSAAGFDIKVVTMAAWSRKIFATGEAPAPACSSKSMPGFDGS